MVPPLVPKVALDPLLLVHPSPPVSQAIANPRQKTKEPRFIWETLREVIDFTDLTHQSRIMLPK